MFNFYCGFSITKGRQIVQDGRECLSIRCRKVIFLSYYQIHVLLRNIETLKTHLEFEK